MSAAEKEKPRHAGQGFGVNHLEAIHMANATAVQANAQQLVRVFDGVIGGVSAQVCDGRELHSFLKNGDRFSGWIKARVEKYGFEENRDFAIASGNTEAKRGGHNRTDYHLTLDMAKELSMVENNEQGRLARRYFIDMERKALSASALAAQSVEQAAFRGRTVLVAYYGGQPWFSAGNLCTALGLGGSDRIIRSLPTQMKRRMQRGSRELWMVNTVGAARAADYCKAELAEDYLAWLRRVVGQQPAPSERRLAWAGESDVLSDVPPEVEQLLGQKLRDMRFMVYFEFTGEMRIKAIDPGTTLLRRDRLATYIGDPEGAPRATLPDILEAVGRRMKCLH